MFPVSGRPQSSTLRFKDLVPVLYQEGRNQGDSVTLGVGGFGRVELVRVFLCNLIFVGEWGALSKAIIFFYFLSEIAEEL